MPHRPPSPLRRAFTLIELLLVISIIAILVSILLPALGKARAMGRQTRCLANLNQLGVGLVTYQGDNKTYYPGHHTAPTVVIVWPTRLRVQAGNSMAIFYCPNNESKYKWERTYNSATGKAEYGYEEKETRLTDRSPFSYGINDWGSVPEFTKPYCGLGAHVGTKDWGEVKESKVLFASEMVCITDSNSDSNWDTAIDPFDVGSAEWPSPRHEGNSNVVWADGHATNARQKKLIEASVEMRRKWNTDGKPHQEYW